jgi:hypothetical protein
MPAFAGMTIWGTAWIACCCPGSLPAWFWIATTRCARLAMTLRQAEAYGSNVFCGAFFQKSDRLLA